VSSSRKWRFGGRSRSWAVLAVVACLGLLLSAIAGRYQLDVLTTLVLYIAAASAWNLVGGIAGQFSLAHSVFIGAGSYAAVMAMRDLGVSAMSAVGLAVAISAVIALFTGLVLFRLRDAYFTVGSMAFTLAVLTWMTIWEFTGASRGISAPIDAVPRREELYLYALAIAVAAIAVSIVIFSSAYGLRVMAVRDDEEVADSLGVSPFWSKLGIMVVSGALTGSVGAVLALQRITVEPFSAFSVDWTMTFVVMSVIGGIGTIWGPVIGAVLVYYGLTVQLQSLPTVSTLVSGALLILVIRFAPNGLLGLYRTLRERLGHTLSTPREGAPVAAAEPNAPRRSQQPKGV
jgi:branched-chain amino acid transport system permease protein